MAKLICDYATTKKIAIFTMLQVCLSLAFELAILNAITINVVSKITIKMLLVDFNTFLSWRKYAYNFGGA